MIIGLYVNKETLIETFKRQHPDTEIIIKYIEPNDEKLQNCLKYLIDENNLPETDCVKLYNKTYILENIKRLKYNFEQEVKLNSEVNNNPNVYLQNVEFNKFSIEDLTKFILLSK